MTTGVTAVGVLGGIIGLHACYKILRMPLGTSRELKVQATKELAVGCALLALSLLMG
jgi:hypothetical protein